MLKSTASPNIKKNNKIQGKNILSASDNPESFLKQFHHKIEKKTDKTKSNIQKLFQVDDTEWLSHKISQIV